MTATDAYREGRVEIQDLGSQLLLEAVGVEPGGRWFDACAGAGGKSLQLAALLGPAGRIDAHDVRPAALEELTRRAARAGLAGRITARAPGDETYDGVLVDAPCSGSGTWRRSPHLKWVTSPAEVAGAARRQQALLRQSAPPSSGRAAGSSTRPARWPGARTRRWSDGSWRTMPASPPPLSPGISAPRRGAPGSGSWPAAHDSDGFFVASLRRSGDN